MKEIKTWQERVGADPSKPDEMRAENWTDISEDMQAEIDDLRSALKHYNVAPVAYVVYSRSETHKIHNIKVIVDDEWEFDDDGLGEFWSGNEPLFFHTQPTKFNDTHNVKQQECPKCGVSGIHSCLGVMIKQWTDKEKQDLYRVLQTYSPNIRNKD